jgi:phosphatidylinositol glycan class B
MFGECRLNSIEANLPRDTAPQPSSGVRWLAPPGVASLVLLTIGLRLIPIVFVPSIVWPDEIFQTSEQAHRLVYGSGLVPWEFQIGMRSWLLPGIIAALMELSRVAGDGPDYYIPLLASSFAALAALPVICCFLWGRRLFGLSGGLIAGAVVAVAPELVYLGARTLGETIAGNVLVTALYLLEPGYRVTSRRRLFAGGALLGLVFVLRIQLTPALVVVALWTMWRGAREHGSALLAGAAAVLAAAGVLDTLTLGFPLASVWRSFLYNIYFGVSSTFGVESWDFYYRAELGVWGVGGAALLLLAALGMRRMPLLLVVAVTILAVHSGIRHKEYRFIYPAILLLMVLTGIGLAQLADWAQHWLRQLVETLVVPQDRGKWGTIATVNTIALALGWWCVVSFEAWTGADLSVHRQRGHDNLAAVDFVWHGPPVCGFGLYGLDGGDWSAYGGYTYFHRPVPMYWPKDEAELATYATGFDTLIYIKAPPGGLGFVPQRCFGQVCVARRTGLCASLPMMAMPFPEFVGRTLSHTP